MNLCVTAQPFESCTWVRYLLFLDVTFTHGCPAHTDYINCSRLGNQRSQFIW